MGDDTPGSNIGRRPLHHPLEIGIGLHFKKLVFHPSIELDRLTNDETKISGSVRCQVFEQPIGSVIQYELTAFGQNNLLATLEQLTFRQESTPFMNAQHQSEGVTEPG